MSRINRNKGDALLSEGCIVHGCNAKGVMGAGIAKAVKSKYPEVFKMYIKKLKLVDDSMGTISYMYYPNQVIINGITQKDCGSSNIRYVSYDAISNVFSRINKLMHSGEYQSSCLPMVLNFPLIGCGLANGDWNVVSAIIESEIDEDVELNLWVL